jgi:hypothetical protein
MAAGAAAILNYSTSLGIRTASFDLHRPNAGNAYDEISEEAVAFSAGFDDRHGRGLHAYFEMKCKIALKIRPGTSAAVPVQTAFAPPDLPTRRM